MTERYQDYSRRVSERVLAEEAQADERGLMGMLARVVLVGLMAGVAGLLIAGVL